MTNKIRDLQGSIVAIVTPFKNDGSIDYQAYEALLDFHLSNKTDGILVCGTTGETPTISEDEYGEIVKFTVDKVRGRVPVVAGSGTNSTAKTIKNSLLVQELGVDALLVVGPYYNKPTPEGFYQHYRAIAQAVDLPIVVYNVPGRTGKNIPGEVIIRLAKEFKNISAVKEASGDINQIMNIIDQRPRGFKVYSGDDGIAFLIAALGGDGCISVVANEIPRQFSQMLHLTIRGEVEKGRRLHFKYLKLMKLNFLETNPIPVKTALYLMGRIKNNFRLPMCQMESDNRKTLARELRSLGLIK
jgi:4-hydroxy-tetrahydrodipicolinate synthase